MAAEKARQDALNLDREEASKAVTNENAAIEQ